MMNELAISFASLVKYNEGRFKSAKQAKYLLSMCEDGKVFTTSGIVYRSTYVLFYFCDEQGVVKVEKYLPTTQKTEVTWVRPIKGELSIQDAKNLKRLQRELKQHQRSIASRQMAMDKGEYKGSQYLFDHSMARDREMLAGATEMIAQILGKSV